MKIAIYNVTTTIKYGGVETFDWEVSKRLQKKGYEVHIIAGKKNANLKYPELKIFQYPFLERRFALKWPKLIERLTFGLFALPRLILEGYDIIMINKPFDLPVAVIVKVLRGTKIHFDFNGKEGFPFHRFLARFADMATSASRVCADQMAQVYGVPSKIIYNGIDPSECKPLAPKDSIRKKFGFGKEDKIVLYVGRLIDTKGVQYLIEALTKLADIKELKLIIVGGGGYAQNLKELVKKFNLGEKVFFTGFVTDSDLKGYYSLSDIFVLPSFQGEMFGMAICEAIAFGLAPIVTSCGGMKEIVLDGENGFVVPPEDPETLAIKIRELFADEKLRERMVISGRDRVLKYFTWDKVTDRVIEVLEHINYLKVSGNNKNLKIAIPILLYHNIRASLFDREMSFLAAEGYNTVDLDEYLLSLQGKIDLPLKAIIITFDDGTKNFYDTVFPILKKYGFKATVFINTGYIGKKFWHSKEKREFYPSLEHALEQGLKTDELQVFEYLSWDEIKEMSSNNISFGSHTHTHPVLTRVSKKRLADELMDSKLILEENLGKNIDYLSYPWGTFNKEVMEAVKKAGFKASLAVRIKKKKQTLYSLERILIRNNWGVEDFKKALNGRIKIGMYNVTSCNQIGGVETFTWELSRHLKLKCYDVHLISGKGNLLPCVDLKVFRHRFLSRKKIPKLGIRFIRKFGERLTFGLFAITNLIRQRYDIIHIHKPFDLPIACLVKRITGTGIVFSSHGRDFFPGDRFLLKYVDKIVAVSHANASQLFERYKIRPQVIYNGIDTNIFKPLPKDQILMEGLGIKDGDKVIISAGRLINLKGFDLIIKAVKESISKLKIKLLIIGEGKDEKNLKTIVKALGLEESVKFIGPVPNYELPRYYALSDIFIMASRYGEAFPISIIEAMACAKPVIASNTGGIPEAIIDGETGFLVPVGNVQALGSKIEELLSDENKIFSMGQKSLERARKFFSWEDIAKNFENIYYNIRAKKYENCH